MKEVRFTSIKGVKAAVTSGLAVAAAAAAGQGTKRKLDYEKNKALKVWGMDDIGSDSDSSDDE